MKRNRAEKILAEAVRAATPDVFDSILSGCESKGGEIVFMNEIKNGTDNTESNKGLLKKAVASAAAIALIVGCGLGFGSYQKAQAAETVVSVDAGSAVSVGVNHDDVVVSVYDNAANVQKSDVKGTKAKDAVRTIAEKMVENSIISGDNNVVLVSVQDAAAKAKDELDDEVTDEANDESDDAKKEAEKELKDAVEEVLSEHGINGTVIVQRFVGDESIEEIAREFSISSGKASFIRKILSANEAEKGAKVGDFAGKSIKDIVKYAAKWLSNSGVSISGDGSLTASGATGAVEGSAAGDVNVSVENDANVNVNTGADGSVSTHVDADNGDVKVDLETGAEFSLGVEVDGERFTYDKSDPSGSMIGIIDSIIKAS